MVHQRRPSFQYQIENKESTLTAHAGMGLVIGLFHGLGLDKSLNDHLALRPHRGYSDADQVLTMICANILGGDSVDAVDLLLGQGAIDSTGRIQPPERMANPKLARRIRGDRRSRSLLIWEREGREISLSQKDIRELQLAKGAMAAAMAILLEREGLSWRDVGECVLAGAFGNYVRPASAMKIGPIPPPWRKKFFP